MIIIADSQEDIDTAPAGDVFKAEIIILREGIGWRLVKARGIAAVLAGMQGDLFDYEVDAIGAAL